MLYLKEGSSFHPLRQGGSSTTHLHHTGERLGRDQGAIRERPGVDFWLVGEQKIELLMDIYRKYEVQ